MQQKVFLAVLIAVPLLTQSGAAFGRDILSPIVVSALRTESDINTAATIIVIDREEIERSGARTVAEVLRGQGGIQVRDLYGNGQRTSVSLRGFGDNAASNTLVLLDGRRLNNSDLASPDLGVIAVAEVERIEIVYGGAGVLFGDQAVGGVINIITRRDRLGSRGDVRVTAGSHGLRETSVSAGHGGDRVGVRVAALKRGADHYRDNNREDTEILSGRVDWDAGPVDLFAEVLSSRENLRLPGGLFADELEADRRQSTRPDDHADTDANVWRLGAKADLGAQWHMEADVAQRRTNGEGALSGFDFQQTRDYRSLHPRATGPLGSGVLTVGMDLERNDYELSSVFGTTDAEQRLSGGYALAMLPLGDRVETTLGMRRNTATHNVRDSNNCPDGERFSGDANAWEAGIAWRLGRSSRVYARAADVFRFPKADELTYTTDGCGRLEVQEGRSWEMGTEWRGEALSLRGVLWMLDLKNEIDFDPSAGSFGANSNLDRTRREGLILEAGVDVTRSLSLSAQYTWTRARFREGIFSGNDVPLVAQDQLRLTSAYQAARDWHLFGELHYSGDSVAAGDYDNALARLPAYTVGNVGVSWIRGLWRLQVRMDNVFDRKYSDYAVKAYNPWPTEETAFYPAPERSVRVTAEVRFR